MYMSELWETIDNTICLFTEQSEKSYIMWKNNILYSIHRGFRTDKVLCGSKTIISVPNQNEANSLVKMLRATLKEPHLLVKDAKTKKERPYKLKIKVITCAFPTIDSGMNPEEQKRICGKMLLKKSKIAVTMHNLSINQIHGLIGSIFKKKLDRLDHEKDMISSQLGYKKNPDLQRSILDRVDSEIEEIISRQENLKDQLNTILQSDRKYCMSGYKPYARSYRITYNDITDCRKQITVGDVLIVVGGSQVSMDSRMPKERSDIFANKHPRLFYVGTPYDYSIYDEYKVDKVVK